MVFIIIVFIIIIIAIITTTITNLVIISTITVVIVFDNSIIMVLPCLAEGFPPSKEKENAQTKAQILSAEKSRWLITTQRLFYIMICAKIQTGYNGF